MMHEGHERHSKHSEAAGASGSSQTPSAQPKILDKRARPRSLREYSSPKDSLPHGATPTTPDKYECLKMRLLEVHTNREVVHYKKFESTRIVEQCQIACYNKSKERGTDEHFWTFFHRDWYGNVLYQKTRHVVPMQWVHLDYMRKKKEPST
jgi:hypothetical protein